MNVPDKWTVLMTGDNNGILGEFGCKFDGSPSHYELVDVQRIPAAPVAAPAPSEWISVKDRLPEAGDYSVMALWSDGGVDMVHVDQYFADITNGVDDDGKQLYTKWYLTVGITHWMRFPPAPVPA